MIQLLCPIIILLLAGCGADTGDANIGGTVEGLSGGTSVGLLNNNTDPISVGANIGFTFDGQISAGSTYTVAVVSQPVGETCTVTNGTGTVDQGGDDVTNIVVSCLATVTSSNTVVGTVSGLAAGASVTLRNNGSDMVTVSSNGPFSFPAALAPEAPYDVTVGINPAGQTCTVTNGAGAMPVNGSTTSALVFCD